MKKKLVLCLAILAAMLSACQPTPEKAPIIMKAEPTPGTNTETTISESYVTPEEWEASFSFKGADCTVKSRIRRPENMSNMVYAVEQHVFTSDDVMKCIKTVAGMPVGIKNDAFTKEELMEQLVSVKRGTFYSNEDGTWGYEPFEGQDDEINRLEQLLAGTPNEEEYQSFDPLDHNLPNNKKLLLENGGYVIVQSSASYLSLTINLRGLLQPESWVLPGDARPGEAIGTTLNNVKITQSDARNTVYAMLTALGVEGFDISRIEKGRFINENTNDVLTEGWYIECSFSGDGGYMPVSLNEIGRNTMLDLATALYSAPWKQERFMFFVDEQGVRQFKWSNPLNYHANESFRSDLMPFEEIQERIIDLLKYGLSWTDEFEQDGVFRVNMMVYDIAYTTCLIPRQNQNEGALLIPAWICFYANERYINTGVMPNVLCVSAIDGSRIDPLTS